jgi:hypothetical protein
MHEAIVEHITANVDRCEQTLWKLASETGIRDVRLSFGIPFGDVSEPITLVVDQDGDVMWDERVVVHADGRLARLD